MCKVKQYLNIVSSKERWYNSFERQSATHKDSKPWIKKIVKRQQLSGFKLKFISLIYFLIFTLRLNPIKRFVSIFLEKDVWTPLPRPPPPCIKKFTKFVFPILIIIKIWPQKNFYLTVPAAWCWVSELCSVNFPHWTHFSLTKHPQLPHEPWPQHMSAFHSRSAGPQSNVT